MPLRILSMAALNSLSHILNYITFLFSEWSIGLYSLTGGGSEQIKVNFCTEVS